MKARELSLNEKKACITLMIALLIERTEEFICHCFSEFVKEETDMEFSGLSVDTLSVDIPENFMHIIFPELYNELKNLVDNDTAMEKYNSNYSRLDGRMGDTFEEGYKCAIWFSREVEERVHFLNDLNDSLKE